MADKPKTSTSPAKCCAAPVHVVNEGKGICRCCACKVIQERVEGGWKVSDAKPAADK